MKKTIFRLLFLLFLIGVVAVAALLFTPKPLVQRTSDYVLTSRLAVNQSSYYPLQQTLDPKLYHPLAQWVGRLILPNPEEFQSNPSLTQDWIGLGLKSIKLPLTNRI